LLLVLNSPGGDVAAAYFIGKLCREHTESSFRVAVPRRAKSAATLISCAADEIHMGSLSELGPIDPQIDGKPALAVKHSVEHLSELAAKYPGSATMLSTYLSNSLSIEELGYYERAAHSAVQYAERLLASRAGVTNTPEAIADIARRLVYEYKDHGFAIDHSEAALIFGSDVVRRNSEEYKLANRLYDDLDGLNMLVEFKFERSMVYTGALGAGAWVRKRSR
jgi:membrane-bound ClpP family serine protease